MSTYQQEISFRCSDEAETLTAREKGRKETAGKGHGGALRRGHNGTFGQALKTVGINNLELLNYLLLRVVLQLDINRAPDCVNEQQFTLFMNNETSSVRRC